MARKRLPILQKVSSNLLKVSIIIDKMRKPIISKLILFKKSRKLKKFKLMRHYNYGFLTEYQFSPSNSPLIQYRRKPVLQYNGLQQVYSMLFHCRCLGSLRDGGGGGDIGDCSLQALPAMEDDIRKQGALLEPLGWEDEDDSIDLKAERFIERFYEQMRMQRQIPL
ncbi:hypothetical protein FEM48_Zijuj10G0142600 [Ziziphus jujuba var. spinosa]|uniref:Uncharacterized protein n=1 Tax=Ziziphus jujuba var. spinosa TaxID=714518 RepID=A0A978UNV6_ZIZJJ|nr:hypothetical protein FEM48_Zijuj10G0142600 [Ziziphus jujuba var. spinosa]